MRMLFTTLSGSGHINVLVPIAQASMAAGHEVAFACRPDAVSGVERLGFEVFPVGFERRGHSQMELFPGFAKQPHASIAYWATPQLFIRVHAMMVAPDLLILGREWAPDIIVRETAEYAGCVVAEVLGIPHASVRSDSVSAAYGLRHLTHAALGDLRDLMGLEPDPEMAMPFRYLHLAPEPPGFLAPGDRYAPTAHLIQPVNIDRRGDEDLPGWVTELPDQPLVYVTLGTFVSRLPEGRALFCTLLEALRDEPINIIMTVGPGNEPAQYDPLPPNVRVAEYIPQTLLFPHCDAVVHHGGFNTLTTALNAGLPMVIIPVSADQFYNAECAVPLGVGLAIDPEERSPDVIRTAVREVLTNTAYRTTAGQLREALAVLPGPDHAVKLLEPLVTEQRPLTAHSDNESSPRHWQTGSPDA